MVQFVSDDFLSDLKAAVPVWMTTFTTLILIESSSVLCRCYTHYCTSVSDCIHNNFCYYYCSILIRLPVWVTTKDSGFKLLESLKRCTLVFLEFISWCEILPVIWLLLVIFINLFNCDGSLLKCLVYSTIYLYFHNFTWNYLWK